MKHVFIKTCICLTLITFCFTGVAIAESTINEILTNIKEKADLINSYRINYNLDITKGENVVNSKGYVEFLAPDKFYMEVKLPKLNDTKQIFISDGNTLWQYIPNMRMATKLRLNDMGEDKLQERFEKKGDIRDPFRNMEEDSIKLVKESVKEGKKIYIIEAKPKDKMKQGAVVDISKARTWINAKNGIPEKVIWYNDKGKIVIEQEFKDIEVNCDINRDRFMFVPPSDVEVMDLTNKNKN